MTNGEKLRQMSDEDIARFWAENVNCSTDCPIYDECLGDHKNPRYHDLFCEEIVSDWLKQEVADDQGGDSAD